MSDQEREQNVVLGVSQILNKITDVMASHDDSQRVLDAVVRLVTEMFQVDRCSLMLIEGDPPVLRIRAAHGLKPSIIKNCRWRLGESICGWVAVTGRPLLVNDIESDPFFGRTNRREYTTPSLLSVPLMFRKKVVGVLNVNNKRDGMKLTDNDQLWLSTVANFIAVWLEKARLQVVEVEKLRMDTEIMQATRVQDSFRPKEMPHDADFQYATLWKSARELSGDFYDALALDEGTTALVLGDACGKGVASGLFVARVNGYFRAVANLKGSAQGLFEGVNRFLAMEWQDHSMVTACMAVINKKSHTLEIYNAGHMSPYHYCERTGQVRTIDFDHGFPLGVTPNAKYKSEKVTMEVGDCVVMFSDGITEAQDANGRLFGFDALKHTISLHKGPATAMVESISQAVSKFAGGQRQSDDMTIVVVRREDAIVSKGKTRNLELAARKQYESEPTTLIGAVPRQCAG